MQERIGYDSMDHVMDGDGEGKRARDFLLHGIQNTLKNTKRKIQQSSKAFLGMAGMLPVRTTLHATWLSTPRPQNQIGFFSQGCYRMDAHPRLWAIVSEIDVQLLPCSSSTGNMRGLTAGH